MSPRRSFALTGPSVALDPRTNAVRRDIADIRLAEHVFAPHYAVPMPCVIAAAAALRLGRSEDSEVLGELGVGQVFEVLEFAGDDAWGVAPALGLVGFVPRSALGGAA